MSEAEIRFGSIWECRICPRGINGAVPTSEEFTLNFATSTTERLHFSTFHGVKGRSCCAVPHSNSGDGDITNPCYVRHHISPLWDAMISG